MTAKEKTVTRLSSDYMQQYDAHKGREKRKKQRLIRRLVLFSIVALIVIGSMATYHVKQRVLQADKQEQYAQTQEKMATLQKKEANLNEEIQLLQNEEYVLDIARTNYFFSKEGELIFKIPDEEPSY
ncbi:cell division protein [Virgibacillus phasianinus]|uniref:Cell division protein n=1 Tax=Virgibacillus phasianinus TaxID=2017483 RepID=A0A220U0W9_9BACI|nr:septum formation initiator family protein [Virgibacillus phasianinus]ASK61700.1 cell division protein [Virgibacillus phasianinus]